MGETATMDSSHKGRKIHTFDNGIKVYDDQLLPQQRARYRLHNVHEAEEEGVFIGLIGRITSDGAYLDIGAAVGYYPLLAKKLSPDLHIHSVEPLERHRTLFLEKISLNGFIPSDFTIYDQAVASVNGSIQFVDAGYGSSIIPNLAGSVSPRNLVKNLLHRLRPKAIKQVKAVTLDCLVERIGPPIDLVQIDVQGFETDVLRGAARSMQQGDILNFLIGTHGARVHHACAYLLQKHGYNIEVDQEKGQNQPDGILVAAWRR
jgi:FkbM family methyltransferase